MPINQKAKFIVIVGPESTGKTYLSRQLGKYYKCPIISEYAREYVIKYRKLKLDIGDTIRICNGQLSNEKRASKFVTPYTIFDTDVFSSFIYCKFYYNIEVNVLKHKIQNNKKTLYLLTGINVPWVLDSVRSFPNDRVVLWRLFYKYLLYFRLPYKVITGNKKKRLQKAISIIKKY